MVFSCQPLPVVPENCRVPLVLVESEMGNVFHETATSTRGRVRPAIIDCCRSAAHEAPLHKRLPHPCVLLSGHPWPSKFRERRSPSPFHNFWRLPSPVRRKFKLGLLSVGCLKEFRISPHHNYESGGEERLSGTIFGHGWPKLSAHGWLERVPERRSLPPPTPKMRGLGRDKNPESFVRYLQHPSEPQRGRFSPTGTR